jgi:serine/threonine protein kinase
MTRITPDVVNDTWAELSRDAATLSGPAPGAPSGVSSPSGFFKDEPITAGSANPSQNTSSWGRSPDLPAGPVPSLTDFLAPPQAPDELGRLGNYRILKILGHGGMGVVYEAEDTRLKRLVALKAMLPTLAASASAGKRFLREAEAMAAVEHDHIVRIYQIDEDRGVPYMAMEFLKGEPLDVRLQRENQLPLGDVLKIGREIAIALDAAHVRGLIHRDIKPANIWLEHIAAGLPAVGMDAPHAPPASRGLYRVKLLDFGLARAVSQDSGLTQQGAIIGTPAYMAPEQGRGDTIDHRCDLFSLGVVLYRLATRTARNSHRSAATSPVPTIPRFWFGT